MLYFKKIEASFEYLSGSIATVMNLGKRGLGSFRDDSYWLLSENFSVNAWDQNFFDGSQYSHDHDYYDDNSVHAVRAF